MRIISRKAFLVGSGATLALPFFASLQKLGAAPPAAAAKARRFCGIFFPFGVSLPPKSQDPANTGPAFMATVASLPDLVH